MAQDATKIFAGPVSAVGIAAAGTADAGSFTDLGFLDEESNANIEWTPNTGNISDGNVFQKSGTGQAVITLLQTDPSDAQATLESFLEAKAKIKITTLRSDEYYFIDNVFITYRLMRPFGPGDVHKLEITVRRHSENQDDFCDGPTSI